MNLYYKIAANDLRLIFRDKSLMVMFIVPIAVTLICRYGIPHFAGVVPGISEYFWLIVAAFTSVTASTPSFLVGFLLLDEKDENVHTLIRILPLPENFVLKIRIVLIVLLGFIFSVFILSLNNLVNLDFLQIILLSVLYALISPVLTFAITAFAKNKIEAATMYKGLSVVLFLPVAAFLVSPEIKYFFGIVPFFWTFNAFKLADNPIFFCINFLISVFTHAVVIFLLYRVYNKRNL